MKCGRLGCRFTWLNATSNDLFISGRESACSFFFVNYLKPYSTIMSGSIRAILGDITTLEVDAIVNAANPGLAGGGGVDGAIHRAGGLSILQECKRIVDQQGPCATGNAVITGAGDLQCKYPIHAVGPVWDAMTDHSGLLADCYSNSLKLALANDCKSVAFPNISTGIYGYPKKEAAGIAVRSIVKFLEAQGGPERVVLCCFDRENFNLTQNELDNAT